MNNPLKIEEILKTAAKLHLDQNKSLMEISRELTIPIQNLKKWFKENGIKIRSVSEQADIKYQPFILNAIEDYKKLQNLDAVCRKYPFSTVYLRKILKRYGIPIKSNLISDEEKENIILLYTTKYKNIEEVSLISKKDPKTISEILKDNGISVDRSRGSVIRDDQYATIYDMYYNKKLKIEEIGRAFGVSRSAVINFLRRKSHIIRKRKDYHKYPLDESFFEVIDTEAKAYFLGLLFADGNVNRKTSLVSITLQELDKDILERFKFHLKYECPLSFTQSKKDTQQNRWTLYTCSSKIKNDLIKLGCIPNKSLILNPPNYLPENLIHHFIRGYFDGDGCIYSQKGCATNSSIAIVSTFNVCQWINENISVGAGVGIKNIDDHLNGITKIYRIGGSKQVIKVFDYLYKDATIFLKRKFDKFKAIKERNL